MENHFNEPQRQSSIGIIVMFFDTLQQYLKALWPILIIWLLKFNEINKLYLVLGTLAVLFAVAFVAFLKYKNFTFYIDDQNQEFIISEGIFNKTKTTIQLNKIQQVNINQSLIQRVIGVFELEVDTAGSANKEGKIKAISHLLALSLKSQLLDNDNKTATVLTDKTTIFEEEVLETRPFIRISFISLLKVGITSNYAKSLSLLLLFFITVSDYINQFTGRMLLFGIRYIY